MWSWIVKCPYKISNGLRMDIWGGDYCTICTYPSISKCILQIFLNNNCITSMRSSHNKRIASLYKRNAHITADTDQTSINHHPETVLLTTTIRCAISEQNTAAINIHDDVDGAHSETTYYSTVFLNLKLIFLHEVNLTFAFVLTKCMSSICYIHSTILP